MKRRNFLQLLGLAPVVPSITMAAYWPHSPINEDNNNDHVIKDHLYKAHKPDVHYPDDIIASPDSIKHLSSAQQRLTRLQRTVGHGNFNVLSFDHSLKVARHYSQVGAFTRPELDAMESIFYANASAYGFRGEKPVDEIASRIDRRDIVKVPYSGHFLYRGTPQQMFEKVRKEVGASLILTSGIRSVTKQMYLFLGKASRHNWNLSLASRSLAPPGYSFHGVGDFDVGKKGFARKNFTDAFAKTDEFRRLVDLGYIVIRYPISNRLGVRYEPWHIKVV